MTRSKRIYVLDTNVLMHDPTALFKFEEHDVFIPMMVLEELDNGKKGHSEASRNARQVSRFLNEIVVANGKNPISIVAPCHRVIGTNGALTGFAGGLEGKAFLLQLEGAAV